MTTVTPGQTTTFVAEFREYAPNGPLVDVTNLQFSLIRTDATVILAPTAVGINHLSTGTYSYSYAAPEGLAAGDALAVWTATESSASEQFTIGQAASAATGASPCSPWDPIWCAPLTAASAAISGSALEAATEILYQLSGQRFGICTFTFRPCRDDCADQSVYGGGAGGWWQWGGGGLWPRPALIGGNWFNLTCGGCSGTCSCGPISQAILPSPVSRIVSVKVGGTTLVDGVDYRVDDFRKLVRLGGQMWPYCQDMLLPDTQPNTWSVTAEIGEAVPTIGRYAIGELAQEIMASCIGGACALPRNAVSVTRQGVTIDFPTFSELLRNGLLGLKWTDMFISTYNPDRLRARPQVYDVDREFNRRVGT